MEHVTQPPAMEPKVLRAKVLKRLAQLAGVFALQAAILLVGAGDARWGHAWLYLALYVAFILLNGVILLPNHADLVAERGELAGNVKGWDKTLTSLMGVTSLSLLAVAALDRRNGWWPLGDVAVWVGVVAFTAGYGLVTWAMVSNRFFSGFARIQVERGHVVASSGPYGFIRHPGYAGMAVSAVGTALLLGSGTALLPAVLHTCVLVVRTLAEDRMLHAELPSYPAYAQRVRYRLLPWVF